MKDDLGNDLYDFGSSSKFGIVRPVLDNNNPMAELALNRVTANGHQLNASMSADIQITSFLKANLTSTLIWGQTNGHTYSNAYYGPKASVNGELQKESTESWRQNHTQTLTYYQDFGKHSVTVLLGHEYYKPILAIFLLRVKEVLHLQFKNLQLLQRNWTATLIEQPIMLRVILVMLNIAMTTSTSVLSLIAVMLLHVLPKTTVGVTFGLLVGLGLSARKAGSRLLGLMS